MSETAGKLAEVARALNQARGRGRRLPPMWFLTDETRVPDPLDAIAGLPEGCGVIFRDYGHPERPRLAREVVRAAHDADRLCLIAGDVGLAKEVNADGLHLPEHLIRTRTSWARSGWIITAAAHSAEALAAAVEHDVDAALLSPVFPTASHEGGNALGLEVFTALVADAGLPVYALGGVTDETAPQLLGSGAIGIAAIGSLSGLPKE